MLKFGNSISDARARCSLDVAVSQRSVSMIHNDSRWFKSPKSLGVWDSKQHKICLEVLILTLSWLVGQAVWVLKHTTNSHPSLLDRMIASWFISLKGWNQPQMHLWELGSKRSQPKVPERVWRKSPARQVDSQTQSSTCTMWRNKDGKGVL